MFGLTRREQRWKAEQKAAELIMKTAVEMAKANANADELASLRREVAELRKRIAIGEGSNA